MPVQNARLIAAGDYHTATLTKKGLSTCGKNNHGQLGVGDYKSRDTFTPVEINGQTIKAGDILAIAAGAFHTIILTKEGLFVCGWNVCGQLGLGPDHNKGERIFKPIKINGQTIKAGDILAIAAGAFHTIILTKEGLFVCGWNKHGQLGLGLNHNKGEKIFTPVKINNQTIKTEDILAIAAGNYHTVILTKKDLFTCGWGVHDLIPVKINDQTIKAEDIRVIAAGGYHTVILTEKGLFTYGENNHGQLGVGDYKSRDTFTPVKINDQTIKAEDILAIAAGGYHTVIYTKKGFFVCGENDYGALGFGDYKRRNTFTPIKINGLTIKVKDILAIAAGGYYTTVYTKKGFFACGNNENYQCGKNTQGKNIITLELIIKPKELIDPKKKNYYEERSKYLCGEPTNMCYF